MIINAAEELDVDAIGGVGAGDRVVLGDGLLGEVAAARGRMVAALEAGDGPVYGVNTGMGRHAGVRLSAAEQAVHQRRLLVDRAVGGPPWLPAGDVRTLLLVRLRDLLAPESAVSVGLVGFLAGRISDGFLPCVPRFGLGSAGEIVALAHAFGTLVGVGAVLGGTDAGVALAERGVAPYELGVKEGASLLQGSPLAVTHGIRRGAEVDRLLDVQVRCAAVTVDALGAPRSVYTPAVAGPDAVLARVLARVTELVGAPAQSRMVQAPVSVRVGPQALAHAWRVLDDLREATGRVLAAPTDSPSFVGGEFVSTGGFHAAAVGLRLDAVTAALVHLGELSVQRMHRLLDERVTGLASQLSRSPGSDPGLTPLHKRAVGELHALRRLSAPATLGSMDTSAGQEDVQAFAAAAGEQLRAAIDRLVMISACELVAGHHARVLRGGEPPAALAETHHLVEAFVPLNAERPLGPAVTALADALR